MLFKNCKKGKQKSVPIRIGLSCFVHTDLSFLTQLVNNYETSTYPVKWMLFEKRMTKAYICMDQCVILLIKM